MKLAFALLGLISFFTILGIYLAFRSSGGGIGITTDSMDNKFTLSSPVFENNGVIPSVHTCDGQNASIPLRIEHVPEGTVSMALVMDDPDIPENVKAEYGIEKFNHWVLYNIPPETTTIDEEAAGTLGLSGMGEAKYIGPCPPDREHRYFFRLYALSGSLNFIKVPTLDEVEAAAQGMMIDSTTLIGRYERITQ